MAFSPPQDRRPPDRRRNLRFSLLLLLCMMAWSFFSLYRDQQAMLQLQAAAQALEHKNVIGATNIFDAYLRAHPDEPARFFDILVLCREYGQADLGLRYAQRGMEASKGKPNNVRAQYLSALSIALAEANPKPPQKEAVAAAEQALALDPNNPALLNQLGYLLADNKIDLPRAEDYLTRALKLASQTGDAIDPAFLDSYGWLLYRQGHNDAAVDALTRAIGGLDANSTPDSDKKVYYYHLGAACRQAERFESARRALEIALQYDPDYAPAKAELALLPATPAKAAPEPAKANKPMDTTSDSNASATP